MRGGCFRSCTRCCYSFLVAETVVGFAGHVGVVGCSIVAAVDGGAGAKVVDVASVEIGRAHV